jgi:hypothetical protein
MVFAKVFSIGHPGTGAFYEGLFPLIFHPFFPAQVAPPRRWKDFHQEAEALDFPRFLAVSSLGFLL